ncbi:OmpA family protein [Sulfurimonas microaerophilic]|uniref:OmpA family protein n=1 Tax=Sulfurimonas microaerophilic TaxID=3058392 RepID=UPI0027153ECC|nr:OmpA family protein [Sulfurimonas sp. hsl 1-7]
MKSLVLSSVAVALLVFSGCSSKEPAVDSKAQESTEKVEEVQAPATETVAGEESVVDSSTNEISRLSMDEVESKLPTIYFAFDKFNISTQAQEKIVTAAELGKTGAKPYSVKLEGNCDEWGSDEYNFALGLKRTEAVKNALVNEGIDASRISMVSYGESNPVCTDKTKECWAQNRRVNFKLLP